MDDTVVAAHLRWLQLRGRTGDTIRGRRNALRMLGRALAPVPLLDASAADLEAWRGGLAVGRDTAANYVTHARMFYDWCQRAGLRADNPAAGLPCPPRLRRLPRPVAEDRLYLALAGAPPRVRPWLVLAAWCGLRAREIAYLRRENVLDSLPSPVLLIGHDSAKGRRERAVPLSSFVLGELAPLPARGWLFRRADGRPGPNTPARVSQVAGNYLHQAGLGETLHQFRHRFGTMTYQARRDLRLTQELLGHASPVSAAGYAAYFPADAVDVVEGLPVPRHLRAVTDA